MTIDQNLSYSTNVMRVNVLGTWRFNGGGAKIAMPCGSSVYIYSGGSVTSSGSGSGSSQTIKICGTTYWKASDGTIAGPMAWPNVLLPAELLEFSGEAGIGMVQLRWATASENGSSHFDVERSKDLVGWEVVGTIGAEGHSQERKDYELLDRNAPSGIQYYRLIQLDLDGDRKVYGTVAVDVGFSGPAMQCITDPQVLDRVTMMVPEMSENATPMLLLPATGRTAPTRVLQREGDRMVVQIPALSSGSYVISLSTDRGLQACRFVVLN